MKLTQLNNTRPNTRKAIKKWLDDRKLTNRKSFNYRINEDLTIDTYGAVRLDAEGITKLDNIPIFNSIDGDLNLSNNTLTNLHNIHIPFRRVTGALVIHNTLIHSHVLGILLIKDLNHVVFRHQVAEIINKHLTSDRDINLCQEELIEAGLGEYAKI